jgi:anti-sigma regulatory factor (Ser/Thr protein kinase)
MCHPATLSDMQADAEAAAPQAQPAPPASTFAQLLSPTRRGARLARLLAEQQLADWGWPRGGEATQDAVVIVAELAANAIQHGRVRGRDFRLVLILGSDGHLRIEVTDARADRLPQHAHAGPAGEAGRGLLIVTALADRWGVDHCPAPPARKTVWAELAPPAAVVIGGAST